MHPSSEPLVRRYVVILSILSVSLLVILGRLVSIQLYAHPRIGALIDAQHQVKLSVQPRRGMVVDRRGRVLAMNLPTQSVYGDPQLVNDPAELAVTLSGILNDDADRLQGLLQRTGRFVWLARQQSEDVVAQIQALDHKGIGLIREPRRYYPHHQLGAHVLGIAGIDSTGLEGVERVYDDALRGTDGWELVLRDGRRRLMLGWQARAMHSVDGARVTLTLDVVLQHVAERALADAMVRTNAKGGTVIVMHPYSGAVLAMANAPSFDPNDRMNLQPDTMRNRAITDVFEPGSCFKAFTAAIAIEEQTVDLDEPIDCEKGSYRIGAHTLHDHRPHGNLTLADIIRVSSNIGMHKVAVGIGKERLASYIHRFGFGEPTGIDLPGEVSGLVRRVDGWAPIDLATIPMGQGVAVTATQLASAVCTLANGGVRIQPHVVEYVKDATGGEIWRWRSDGTTRVISSETAHLVTGFLTRAVDEGTGRRARIDNIAVAGKTGTAQKIDPDGTYSHKRFIASFVGYAPADSPMLVVTVHLDEPTPSYFGGTVAAPVFKEVMEQALGYLGADNSMGPENLQIVWSQVVEEIRNP